LPVELFNIIIIAWIGFALIMLAVLLNVSAPYGRHTRKGWGRTLSNRAAWVIMEVPSLLLILILPLLGPVLPSGWTWFFIALWLVHYTNRSLVYPFRTHTRGKQMPALIMVFAIFFNLVNGFLNGYYFGFIRPGMDISWAGDIRFILGVILFATGFVINQQSDHILLSLRKTGKNGYAVPRGGLFKYISCPNFFGEILEWGGFALLTWSPAALTFFIWTMVNLIPRGLDHHRWYKKKFPDYPGNRKAIIPFIL
jgi:protein-S-isoprenylcysteine O-methyltransferase Ste14